MYRYLSLATIALWGLTLGCGGQNATKTDQTGTKKDRAAEKKDQAAKSDKDLIQGTWKMTKMTMEGKDMPKEAMEKNAEENIVTFKGDKTIGKKGGKENISDFS